MACGQTAVSRPDVPAIGTGPQAEATAVHDPRSPELKPRSGGPGGKHPAPAEDLDVVVGGAPDRAPGKERRAIHVLRRSRLEQRAGADVLRRRRGLVPGLVRGNGHVRVLATDREALVVEAV